MILSIVLDVSTDDSYYIHGNMFIFHPGPFWILKPFHMAANITQKFVFTTRK